MKRIALSALILAFSFSAVAAKNPISKSKRQQIAQASTRFSKVCSQINSGFGNDMPNTIQIDFVLSPTDALIAATIDGQSTQPVKLKHWPNRVISNSGLIYQIDWQGAGKPWLMQIFDSKRSFYSASLADYACYDRAADQN